MTARITLLAATLLVALTAAPDAAAERQVEALYKKALNMHGCSERWATSDVLAKCREEIAAYRAAEAASDATDGDREFLVVERLKTQATLVAALRNESSDQTAARRELAAAFKDLDKLAPGTTNPFARVQTLDLQRQAVLLELEGGTPAAADAAINTYREYSQSFLAALEQVRGNDKAMKQQSNNAVDAANFEMELGKHYVELLEDGEAVDKAAVRAKAIEAFEFTRQWAIARADNKWNGFAEASPAVLYTDASLKLAKLALDAGDKAALATHVGEAKAVACVGSKTGDAYNDSELDERCLHVALMERWVTGENQALLRRVSEQNDEQMRAVVEMLTSKK